MIIITGSLFVHLGKTSDIFANSVQSTAKKTRPFKPVQGQAYESVILVIAGQASIVFFRTFTALPCASSHESAPNARETKTLKPSSARKFVKYFTN
jgi:hypothetical protein